MGGGWVLELDIKSFFDTDSILVFARFSTRGYAMERRVVQSTNGLPPALWRGRTQPPRRRHSARGSRLTLLANIYLHEALDLWFEET